MLELRIQETYSYDISPTLPRYVCSRGRRRPNIQGELAADLWPKGGLSNALKPGHIILDSVVKHAFFSKCDQALQQKNLVYQSLFGYIVSSGFTFGRPPNGHRYLKTLKHQTTTDILSRSTTQSCSYLDATITIYVVNSHIIHQIYIEKKNILHTMRVTESSSLIKNVILL